MGLQILEFFKSLGLKRENLIVLTVLTILSITVFNSSVSVNEMHKLEMQMISENGLAVMKTLKTQNYVTEEEIDNFLAPKPAGRSNLKYACEFAYSDLVNNYSELAITACSIFY